MILIDMNQVMISNLMVQINNRSELTIELIRHTVLNSLKSYKRKFGKEYGDLILCYDSKRYWRRSFFEYYKSNRKKDREKSGHDWNSIFDVLNQVRQEIKENLPYKVVIVEGTEADDVIAVLCKEQKLINTRLQNNMQPPNKVLILSGDKDFIQLQKHSFVRQYNPVQKKYVDGVDPKVFILEHVVKGDRSDGIPNIFSQDDTFAIGMRQKPVPRKLLNILVNSNLSDHLNEQQMKNWERNSTLIDLEKIPANVADDILNEYYSVTPAPKSTLYNYLVKHGLTKHLETIEEF